MYFHTDKSCSTLVQRLNNKFNKIIIFIVLCYWIDILKRRDISCNTTTQLWWWGGQVKVWLLVVSNWISHFLYTLICWWKLRLVSYLTCKHGSVNISSLYRFPFLWMHTKIEKVLQLTKETKLILQTWGA
jgi:hypothetical protein